MGVLLKADFTALELTTPWCAVREEAMLVKES